MGPAQSTHDTARPPVFIETRCAKTGGRGWSGGVGAPRALHSSATGVDGGTRGRHVESLPRECYDCWSTPRLRLQHTPRYPPGSSSSASAASVVLSFSSGMPTGSRLRQVGQRRWAAGPPCASASLRHRLHPEWPHGKLAGRTATSKQTTHVSSSRTRSSSAPGRLRQRGGAVGWDAARTGAYHCQHHRCHTPPHTITGATAGEDRLGQRRGARMLGRQAGQRRWRWRRWVAPPAAGADGRRRASPGGVILQRAGRRRRVEQGRVLGLRHRLWQPPALSGGGGRLGSGWRQVQCWITRENC